MKRPSSDAMATAAEWLSVNEGEAPEANHCKIVAAWLREIVAEHQVNAQIKRMAGELGYGPDTLTPYVMRKIKSRLVKKFAPTP